MSRTAKPKGNGTSAAARKRMTAWAANAQSTAKRWARDPQRIRRDIRDSPIRRSLDARVGGWTKQIDNAYKAKEWALVVELINEVLRLTGAADSEDLRLKLIHAHRELGHDEPASKQAQRAVQRYPDSISLNLACAEHAMARNDYASALVHWQRVTDLEEEATPADSARALPTSGTVSAWGALEWFDCVATWDASWRTAKRAPSVTLYRRVLVTLQDLGAHEASVRLANRALNEYPEHPDLANEACDVIARFGDRSGDAPFLTHLKNFRPSAPLRRIHETTLRARALHEDLRRIGPPEADELRITTVHQYSGAAFWIRSGSFWDEERIHAEALRLAKRDHWPEQFADTDLLTQRSWDEALAFAEHRAGSVLLSPTALAQATFHYFKQELTQKIPVDRVADEIAKVSGDEPVYVNLRSLELPYLVSHPTAQMQTLYFYSALRKRGCNVTLVRFPQLPQTKRGRWGRAEPKLLSMPSLRLKPRPAGLRPPKRPAKPIKASPRSLLVPAGIRSVSGVLSLMRKRPLVVNSGSAIKGLAYDRSAPQQWDYDVNSSIHGNEPDLLPTFSLGTDLKLCWRVSGDRLTSGVLAPADNEPVEGYLSAGEFDTSDWNAWLEAALIPYIRDYVRRARKFLQQKAIMDVHVCDYLYTEPSILAAKVRDRGGRVHLWPHSTNPVHVDYRSADEVHSVRTVTRSGAKAWREALPDARITCTPSLMLKTENEPIRYNPGEPLSIVFIGGRPVMRNLPILDIEAHERLYQGLFQGLKPLVNSGKARVFFKPRGMTGEHELWLHHLVGRPIPWSPILEHPSRISAPNPIYVSVSAASSALMEGAVRGIPGMIVRAGHARDYLASAEEIFSIRTLDQALDDLKACTNADGWSSCRDKQMHKLATELGRTASVSR